MFGNRRVNVLNKDSGQIYLSVDVIVVIHQFWGWGGGGWGGLIRTPEAPWRSEKLAAVMKTVFLRSVFCQQYLCLFLFPVLHLSVQMWQRLVLMSWLVLVKRIVLIWNWQTGRKYFPY